MNNCGRKSWWGICTIFILVSCTNARLHTGGQSIQSTSGGDEYYLSTPKELSGPHRYIFFVDMSHSMVSGSCDTDVNNDQEPADPQEFQVVKAKTPGLPCASDKGIDPNADRLTIIGNWLKEIENQPDTQVILMPFSGGIREGKMLTAHYGGGVFTVGKPVIGGFTSVADAESLLDTLKSWHATDLQAAQTGKDDAQFMGTSTPATFLSKLSQFVYSDMKALQASGTLSAASYRMFFISDGVPTPTVPHVKTAFNLKQCPHTCMQQNADPAICSAVCRDYFQQILDYWGNPDDNSFANIRQKFQSLTMLPDVLGEGQFQLNILTIHPEKIEARYQTADQSYILALKKNFQDAKYYDITSSSSPFSLAGANAAVVSYRLTAFYVLNTNYRMNAYGQMEADSDGDGLTDSEEIKLGTDPHKQRTNGVCLDSIAVQDAYKARCQMTEAQLGCHKNWDADGDGLNECEEMILGTNPSDFDSDGDGIPDGLEVLYQTYQGRDDGYLDSNSDNVNNLVNFMAGLMPHHYIDKIPDINKIIMKKEFLGYKTDRQANGQLIQTEGYNIQVLNVPVGPVLGGAEDPGLYFSKTATDDNKITDGFQLLSGPKDPNTNNLIFLARIIDVNDTSKAIWAILKKPVSALKGFTNFSVDLSTMQTLPVRDPIKATEAVKTNAGQAGNL